MRQKFITKCVRFYYKIRQLLQTATVQLCCVRVMAGKHADLNAIEKYLRHKFLDGTPANSDKANFRRGCKKFSLVNCQMMYKANALVIIDEQHRRNIVHDVHQGVGDNAKALASSSYLERTSIYQKITSFLYWYMIVSDVVEYIKINTSKCQRHQAMSNNAKQELKSISVPSNVMK